MIQVESPSDELTGLLAEGLIAWGALAVEEDGPRLRTWVPRPDDADASVAKLRAQLEAATGARELRIEWAIRPDEDWDARWKRGLAPRRAGRHFIVAPSWTTPDAAPDDIVITIDPQMAFGTGEHASTRGVLRLLEDAVRPGTHVLDAGTGSGVLAIAAARLGAARVLAVDNDADALLNARDNIAVNGVAGRVDVHHAVITPEFLAARPGAFHLIAANILSSILMPLLPAFREALAPGGDLLLGGILETEAPDVRAAAARAGLVLRAEDEDEGWWSGRFSPG